MSENLTSGSSSGENAASAPVRNKRSSENLASPAPRQSQPAQPRRPAKVVEEPKASQPIKVMKPLELKKKKD
jgi:hypothetical protein